MNMTAYLIGYVLEIELPHKLIPQIGRSNDSVIRVEEQISIWQQD